MLPSGSLARFLFRDEHRFIAEQSRCTEPSRLRLGCMPGVSGAGSVIRDVRPFRTLMETSPNIGTLIAGCLLAFVGVFFSLGVFIPERRMRWGRRGQGGRMCVFSQVLWSVGFIFFGVAVISSAFHQTWPDRVIPFVVVPLLAVMFIMGWYDSRKEQS